MTRRSLSVSLGVVCLTTVLVRADVPPPRGQVRVPVDHIIETDKAYPDYVFVVVIGGDAEWSYKADVGKDKPLRIEGKNRNGRARLCWLTAVPAEAAREFKTDKELIRAIVENKVKGALQSKGADLDAFTVVPEKDAPKVVEQRHRIERVTRDEGIVLASARVGVADDPDPDGLQEESMVRWAVAGVMAAVAICGLGLWFVARRRGSAV